MAYLSEPCVPGWVARNADQRNRTVAPRDHISTAVVHGTLNMTSGARYIGAPMMCSPLLVATSCGTESPRSPNLILPNRVVPVPRSARILSGLMSAATL